jgi:cytochrome c556
MSQGKILFGVLFGCLTLLISSHLFAQAEVSEKRQKLMKSNGEATKAIKAAAEAKDYVTIEVKAKDIMANGDKILDFFPKGSMQGKTKAKPEIWEKWDDFSKQPAEVKKAASELAAAAKANDDAAITVKVKALGDACASCHKSFRAEKYAE